MRRKGARNFPLFSVNENLDFQIFPKLFLAESWNIRNLPAKKFGKRVFSDSAASLTAMVRWLGGHPKTA
jgi:hypothetical protein